MNRTWTLGICLLIFAVICSAFVLATQGQPRTPAQCDSWVETLSQDNPEYIVRITEEGCSGFYNATTYAIALSQIGGAKTTFFKYYSAEWNPKYEGQTTPLARWTARGHLEISIGAVSEIITKRDKVDDITIAYHIGHVLHE